MKIRWGAMGGQVGIAFVVAGVVLVFLGWNGAASYDDVPAQFPYLISGGLAGVGMMVVGGALLVVQNSRLDRAALQQGLAELREAIEVMGRADSEPAVAGGPAVVAGPTSFHRVECSLLEGRGALPHLSAGEAVAAGLAPCRVCEPLAGSAPSPRSSDAPAPATPARATKKGARKSAATRAPAKKTTGRKAPAKKSAAKKISGRKRPAAKKAARRR